MDDRVIAELGGRSMI